MMQPLAVLLEEAPDGGVVRQRFQELDLATGKGQQRDLDPLARDLLDALDLESQHLFVEDAGVDDGADGDTYMGESDGHRGPLRRGEMQVRNTKSLRLTLRSGGR